MERSTSRKLCYILRDRDGWLRSTAHRLLLERRDLSAVKPLREHVDSASGAAPFGATTIHALHLLNSLDALTDDLLRTALRHRAPEARENALQLIETRIPNNPDWLSEVLPCAHDSNARVRFQAAIALGAYPGGDQRERDDAWIAAALARIAAQDGADRWARAAVFGALAGRELAFLSALGERPKESDILSPELLVEFGRLLGASRPQETWPELVLGVVVDRPGFAPEERAAMLTGLAESARGRLATTGQGGVLSALLGKNETTAAHVRNLVAAMIKLGLDAKQPLDLRRTAVGLLAFADYDQAGEPLLRLVEATEPNELQVAAVRALGSHRDGRVSTALLSAGRFASYTPALRDEVLSAVVSRPEHRGGLISALEGGRIPIGAIDAQGRRQLTQSQNPEIRTRAEKLFGAVPADRAKVYDEYKSVIALKSDPARGRAVFRRECASCHRLDREGSAVGPDLFGVRNQPKEAILLHILVPDQEITQGFAAYSVATRDGRVLTGLIASESPNSITLRQPLGKEETLLRSEIDELNAGKQSLMPQGLEKSVSRQEFADLLAYLKGEGGAGE